MKKILVLILLSACLAIGDEGINVGDFTYEGTYFKDAQATFVSADSVRINGIVIPWDKLNATVQFKLKPYRQKIQELEASQPKETVFVIQGKVIFVRPEGCAISARRIGLPPSDPLRRIGGSSRKKIYEPPPLPEVEGTIFVKGLTGLADGEFVSIKAMKTEEVFNYTSAIGAAKTIRIYNLVAQ
jgi:hypothetical protein